MMDSNLCSTACTRVEAHLALVMFGPHSILKKGDGKNKNKKQKTEHSFTSQESDFGFGLPLRVNERTLGDSSPPTIGGVVKTTKKSCLAEAGLSYARSQPGGVS